MSESFFGAFCVGTSAAGMVVGGIVLSFYLASMPDMVFSAANLCVPTLLAVSLGAGIGHVIRGARLADAAAVPTPGEDEGHPEDEEQ